MRKNLKLLFFAVLVILLCAFFCTLSSAEGVNRVLAIGCDNFISMPSTAPCSMNNVMMISTALSGGSMNLENLVTRVNNIYSVEMLEEAVEDAFSMADEEDVSYFYISTHGKWAQGIPGWDMELLLSNGRREESITALGLKEILDRVPGKIVLMVDACHSGAMIGKGMHPPFDNIFSGEKYKVIVSGGGEEGSWFWNASTNRDNLIGAGFFSGAVQRGISYVGGYGADENKDGCITLSELKHYLLANHAASTTVCYPEEDDFPILRYDARAFSYSTVREAVGNVEYSSDYVTLDEPAVDFSFTVLENVKIIYQLVYHQNNKWDFENCVALYDSDDGISLRDTGSVLSPGRKERSLELKDFDKYDTCDYVMLQIICRESDNQYLLSSHTFGILTSEESPILEVLVQPTVCPEAKEELGIVVHHIYPGEMTITVENSQGETTAYITRRKLTRPQEMLPWGTTYCWNGRKSDGSMAAEGTYRIRVKEYIGSKMWEETSRDFTIKSK